MKTVGLVLLWLLGSGTAVAVAWQGVSIVDNQVINPPHAALATPSTQGDSAIEFAGVIPDDLGGPNEASEAPAAETGSDDASAGLEATAVESASPTADANASPAPDVEPTTDDGQVASQPTGRPAPTPRPTTTPRSGGGSAESTPQPSPTSTPSPVPQTSAEPTAEASPNESPSPSGSPTVPDGPPETLSFDTNGGSASIYFSSTSVEVLVATAKEGYSVKVEQRGSTGVRVEFENEDNRSRIDASWNGSAQVSISEN